MIQEWKTSFLVMGILLVGVAQSLNVPMLWAPAAIFLVCSIKLGEKR